MRVTAGFTGLETHKAGPQVATEWGCVMQLCSKWSEPRLLHAFTCEM